MKNQHDTATRPAGAVLGGLCALLMYGLSHAAEIDWIQGEWISDAEASVAANPEFQNLDAAQREAAEGMFGRMRWTISGDVLSTRYEDSEAGESRVNASSFAVEHSEGEDLRSL